MAKHGKCASCGEVGVVRIANDLHGKRKFVCSECWWWEVKKRAIINGKIAGKFYPEYRTKLP